jgi:hypothetical protein
VRSTEAVLCHLNAPIIDQLFDDGQYALDDGLSARIVRLGPEQLKFDTISPNS